MRVLVILLLMVTPTADHTKKYGDPCKETRECPTDAICSRGKCVQGPM